MTREKSALLVVDMQHDFIHGSLAIKDAATIIDKVNGLIKLPFKIKVASKDWHPRNHISFAEVHGKPEFATLTVYPPDDFQKKRPHLQELWPVHCVESTPGAAFVAGLNCEPFTNSTVYKGDDAQADSYSAFRDCWRLHTTTLPALLKDAQVTDLFIAGLAGDFCVKFTAMDAIDYGYRVWVVRDAVKSVSDSGKEWLEMEDRGIHIIDSEEVSRRLKA